MNKREVKKKEAESPIAKKYQVLHVFIMKDTKKSI